MRIAHLNVGNKWDFSFLDSVIELNKKYESNLIRVNELYGNIQDPLILGVRPDSRIPKMSDTDLEKYIKKCNKNNIEINITVNKSCLGNLQELELGAMQNRINFYKEIGARRFTIFSPYLIINLEIERVEISTIHNNSNINYLIEISKIKPNIDKICLPIYMNRDFNKLKKCSEVLPNPEVILNEFCVSGKNICFYRSECYNIQSHNQTMEYPFENCSLHRSRHPLSWLKAPFILPQWIILYTDLLGIWKFKLTGRTHSAKSLLKVIEYYMKRKYEGPIQKLWGEGLPHQELNTSKEILAEDLSKVSFIHKMMMGEFVCETMICGTECFFCSNILREIIKSK